MKLTAEELRALDGLSVAVSCSGGHFAAGRYPAKIKVRNFSQPGPGPRASLVIDITPVDTYELQLMENETGSLGSSSPPLEFLWNGDRRAATPDSTDR